MGRLKETGISSVIKPFEEYSQVLAEQLQILWRRSFSIMKREQISSGDQVTLTKSSLRRCVLELFAAMPYIMKGLNGDLKKEWVDNGLDALGSSFNRDLFVWVMNREVYNGLGSSQAESTDIGFSNILAMHTGNVAHKPQSGRLHIRFKAFSPALARHVADLYQRAILKDGKPHTLELERLRKSLRSLSKVLPIIINKLPKEVEDRLFEQGLDYLSQDDDYNLIEYLGVHGAINKIKLETRFYDALTNIRSMHFNQEYLPFAYVRLNQLSIDISRAMILTYAEFCDLKGLMQTTGLEFERYGNRSSDTIAGCINASVNHLVHLLENDLNEYGQGDTIKDRIVCHSEIVRTYVKNQTYRPHEFNAFLSSIAPEVNDFYGLVYQVEGETRALPNIGKKQFDVFLLSISDSFAEQCKKYIGKLEEKNSRAVYGVQVFIRYLYLFQEDEKVRLVINILKSRCIEGLADNNGFGFIQLSHHIEQCTIHCSATSKTPINASITMYNQIKSKDVKLSHFSPYIIIFNNENDGTVSSSDFTFVAKHYLRVFDDIHKYAEVNKTKSDGNAIQEITVKSQLNVILAVFKKYHDTLDATDIALFNKQGLAALGCQSSRLLKHFRQSIQLDYKSGKLKGPYAKSMQTSLNQVVSFFGVPASNSYLVSSGKTDKLAERNKKKTLYSFQQVVEIAYAIEKSLRRENLTSLQRLCLHAARIFVKTGWNLTPTLELDDNDLVYFDAPFQGNKTAAVRLFKRRAGYKTTWAKFSAEDEAQFMDADTVLGEFETGNVTAAVISNLEAIRDMTKGVAVKHPSATLRNRIFAYQHRETVRILNGSSFRKCINELLKREGVKEAFTVNKIRKKGMNYTYRKVAKNFEKYQKAGMHTPQAFYQYYLKMDGTEVEDTLTKATSVMGDFFIRGKSDDVIFVNKVPDNSKQTPSGRCVQTQDSDVVADFKRRNRKFFDDDEIKGCANFGACLFCPHFRCVADAEGVWRLLSFEKVVIERMVSASYSIGRDDGSDQQRSIQRIERRCKEIMADLTRISKEAVHTGRNLFEEHGVHPDWEIV
ncbi:hypothetical protein H4F17_06070 [Vibrio cholerae]